MLKYVNYWSTGVERVVVVKGKITKTSNFGEKILKVPKNE